MKSTVLFILPIICIGILVGCAPVSQKYYTEKGLEPLTANQIRNEFVGKSIQLKSIDFNATISYRTNHTLVAQSHTGNKDSGRWSLINDDTLCMKFSAWHYGDEQCYRIIYDKDSFIFFTLNGALGYTGSIVKDRPSANVAAIPPQTQTDSDKTVSNVQPVAAQPTETAEERKNRIIRLAKNCPGCNLSGVDLQGAQLNKANLTGANLQGVNLTNAELRQANLQGADLTGAVLVRANLAGADLSSSNLTDTDFSGSNLIRANVSGAIINNTNVTGAHLESIQGKIQ